MFCDGSLFWSSDQLRGGAPYFRTRLPVDKVSATIRKAAELVDNREHELRTDYRIMDGRNQEIVIRSAGITHQLRSSHELLELNSEVLATSRGVVSRNGRSLLSARRNEPADYLIFRTVWADIRNVSQSLIQSASPEKTLGTIEYRDGEVFWVTVNEPKFKNLVTESSTSESAASNTPHASRELRSSDRL